jgi:hypothetical protein
MVGLSTTAQAQNIGTFSWQMQPHCNVITVTVIQQGGLYQLTGVDNLCGAGAAPVTGTAVPGAGGTVTLGFMITETLGGVAHVSAQVALNTLSGTWRDARGTTGSFVFGTNTGGMARPTTLFLDAVTGGNGEGLGGSVCSPAGGNTVEIITRNVLGIPTDARFSFIIPGHSHGQIRASGDLIRNSTPNLLTVQHPGPGLYCLVFSAPVNQLLAESTVVSIHANQ